MSEHDKLRQDALAPSVATLGEEELHAYLVALVHNAGHSASYEHVDDVMEWVASKVAECKAAAAHIEAQAAEIARWQALNGRNVEEYGQRLVEATVRAEAAEAEVENLRRHLGVAESRVDALLKHCPDSECYTCAEAVCPYGERLHFHHDGCPACFEADAMRGGAE